MPFDPTRFITQHLRPGPVEGLDSVVLYQAHPGSRLSRLGRDEPPYWAYAWGGGLVLARYLERHAAVVRGKRVLDLGAGSGLVGIAAARLGASVRAAEIDPFGQAAIILNAKANAVAITLFDLDLAGSAPEGFDVILAGDVFYLPAVAARMLPFLKRCAAAGMVVLIGDPNRRDLPVGELQLLESEMVWDMGGVERAAGVYALRADLDGLGGSSAAAVTRTSSPSQSASSQRSPLIRK